MKPVFTRGDADRLDATGLSRVLPQTQSLCDASRRPVVSMVTLTPMWLLWNVGRVITEDNLLNRHEAKNIGAEFNAAMRDMTKCELRNPKCEDQSVRQSKFK